MTVPEVYNLDDTIYHYTSYEAALKILESNGLWLSERKNSRDPIENNKPFVAFSSYNAQQDLKHLEIEKKEANVYINSKYAEAKQLSFCKSTFSNHTRQNKIDSFGFIKPRMWEQYGDNYTGVCLAFSLSKIMQNLSLDMIGRKVEYMTYEHLNFNFHSINVGQLTDMNMFYRKIDKRINDYLCCKHVDYSGECEFRVLSFTKKEKDILNISECLVGIVLSRASNRKLIEEGFDVDDIKVSELNKYGVDILNLKWGANGIRLSMQSQDEMRVKQLSERFKVLDSPMLP